MLSAEISKTLHEVPEHLIEEAASQMGGDNWKSLLIAAKIFRHAGANPIFLANPDSTMYVVTSEETKNSKRLH